MARPGSAGLGTARATPSHHHLPRALPSPSFKVLYVSVSLRGGDLDFPCGPITSTPCPPPPPLALSLASLPKLDLLFAAVTAREWVVIYKGKTTTRRHDSIYHEAGVASQNSLFPFRHYLSLPLLFVKPREVLDDVQPRARGSKTGLSAGCPQHGVLGGGPGGTVHPVALTRTHPAKATQCHTATGLELDGARTPSWRVSHL